MDVKKLRENKQIVDKVEEALQAAYSSSNDFNTVLDASELAKVKGVKDVDQTYF
jgi:hypothetical protein